MEKEMGPEELRRIGFRELPETAVIGREGLCTAQENLCGQLWEEANARFEEVAALGKRTESGAYTGFWGAMSDETRSFRPWTEHFSRGLYLAGIETEKEAEAPEGWTKWILPARRYLVAEVRPEIYGEVFTGVLEKVLPKRGLKLCGAVCDFTDPVTGRNELLFPVEEL